MFSLRHQFKLGIAMWGASLAVSAAGSDYRTALNAFTGEWEGEMRIHALDGFLLKTFTAERTYAWEGDVQIVVTKFSDGANSYETRARSQIQLGRLHAEVARPGQPLEEFSGAVNGSTVVWTNAARNTRDFKETLSNRNGATTLEVSGLEAMRVSGVTGVVRVESVFRPQAIVPVVALSSATELVAPAAGRVTELERSLAESQAATVSAQNEVAALTRERDALRERTIAAEAAETRLRELEQTVATLQQQAQVAVAAANEQQQRAAAQGEQARRRADDLAVLLARNEAELATARAASTSTAEVQQRLSAGETEAAELRSQLERSAAQVAALSQRVEQLRQQQEGATDTLAERERRVATAAAQAVDRVADLERQVEVAIAARDEANAQAGGLTTQLTAMRAELEKVRSGSSVESGRLQQLERDLATANTLASTRTRELEQLRSEQATVAARADKAVSDLAAATGQLAEAKIAAGTRAQQTAGAALENARLVARVQELENNVAAAASARQSSDAAVKETAALQSRLSELQRELERSRVDLAAQKSEAEKLSERAVALETAAAEAVRLRTEREALAARVADLSSATTERDQMSVHAAALSKELAALRTELEKSRTGSASEAARAAQLQTELATAQTEATRLKTERDELSARAASFESRPAVSTDALETERRQAREKLAAADVANRSALARVADLEKQLETARAQSAQAGDAAAQLADLRQQLTQAQQEATTARTAAEKAQAERDAAAARVTAGTDAQAQELAGRQRAELAAADFRRQALAAEARVRELETLVAAGAATQAELTAQRASIDRQEQENSRLVARLEAAAAERESLLARIGEVETAAKPVSSPPLPATGTSGNVAVREEISKLEHRVVTLESERNSLRDKQTLVQSQLEQAQQLRDDTLARFQDVVSQLNAMREERDRLARANVSLQAEVRAVRGGAPATPVATEPANPAPSFLERLLGPDGAEANPPASAPSVAALEKIVAAFEVIGITHTATEDKVILNGRLYRNGNVVDAVAGLVFQKIDGDALVFTDRSGREYRRRF